MKRVTLFCFSILIVFTLMGCATIETRSAKPDEVPDGIRVYPTRIYLLVDSTKTQIICLPNYEEAYDIKPRAILSKNNFQITIKEGQIKTSGSNLDTTDITELMTEALNTGGGTTTGSTTETTTQIKEPEASKNEINGTFGLAPGIYWLDNKGEFHPVKVQ